MRILFRRNKVFNRSSRSLKSDTLHQNVLNNLCTLWKSNLKNERQGSERIKSTSKVAVLFFICDLQGQSFSDRYSTHVSSALNRTYARPWMRTRVISFTEESEDKRVNRNARSSHAFDTHTHIYMKFHRSFSFRINQRLKQLTEKNWCFCKRIIRYNRDCISRQIRQKFKISQKISHTLKNNMTLRYTKWKWKFCFDSFAGNNVLLRIRTIAILILSYPGVCGFTYLSRYFIADRAENIYQFVQNFVRNGYSNEKFLDHSSEDSCNFMKKRLAEKERCDVTIALNRMLSLTVIYRARCRYAAKEKESPALRRQTERYTQTMTKSSALWNEVCRGLSWKQKTIFCFCSPKFIW